MRSSTGLYVSRLDHMRALAAFLVYCWHFLHIKIPYEMVPTFMALSLFEEGHAGVALFMTLSGYLFAKIMDGRKIDFGRFYRNRLLRLVPLLSVVLLYWALRGQVSLEGFVKGFLSFPTWPPGTWSIVVEFHFYLGFPLLLVLQRVHRIWPLIAVLAISIALRTLLWQAYGEVQWLSYWTIIGCIDLFVLGMLWHELAGKQLIKAWPGLVAGGSLIAIIGLWHAFNGMGGFYGLGGYPSSSAIWIVIPTLQGLLFGALIAGYERMAVKIPGMLDRGLARTGEVSYSIYLVQFIVYPTLGKYCGLLGFDLGNFSVAMALAVATFPVIVLISNLTYELIEKPFLRWRRAYVEGSQNRFEAKPEARWVPVA
jgi:peptidoglycan/LPS O-acetylase OafA/YrhL